MYRRGRVKPSKPASALGMVVGVVFVIIGLTQLHIFGGFGLVWTFVAAAITLFHAYNFFSDRGASYYDVDVQVPAQPAAEDFEAKLRKLEALRRDGLITEEEYARKRAEIIDRRW